MKKPLPGVKPEQVWQADHVLVLPGGLVILKKRAGKKEGYSVTIFDRGSGSTHTGGNTLEQAIREAKRQANRYQDDRINRSSAKHALRALVDTL